MTENDREKWLMERLSSIHKRVQWIANEEARSAWFKGVAARGGYLERKERLIEDAERILAELSKKPDDDNA
jgi:hypothetical protein